MSLTYALDLNASCESSGAPRIGDNWDFQPFKDFAGKTRQSDVTKFHGKLDIPNDFETFFIFAQWVRGPQLVLYKWV